MQNRMKTHQLTQEQVAELLKNQHVGTLATVNKNGSPYVTPVHFVYEDGKIYIHGLPAGQKVENIIANGLVSFNAYNMNGYLMDAEGKPCDTNTAYQSVIAQGKAAMVKDKLEKTRILHLIVEKYTPQLSDKILPDNMVNGTGVIAVEVTEITGKYWE